MPLPRLVPWLAAALTLAAAAAIASSSAFAAGAAGGALPLALLVAWGSTRPLGAAGGATAAAFATWAAAALLWGLGPGPILACAAHAAGGAALGWGLARRRPPAAVLGLATAPALLLLALTMSPAAAERVLEETGRRLQETLTLPPAGMEAQGESDQQLEMREAAAASVERTVATLRRLWPALLLLGLLLQAAAAVWLVRRLAARAGRATELTPWPPLRRWRMPFALVWILAGGIALVLARGEPAARAGVNLIAASAALLALQGAAVVWALATRVLPPLARWLIALAALLLLAPACLLACAAIGLADQWLDVRRGSEAAAGDGPA